MNKVVVIGNAGGGKTTLSRAVSQKYDLPHLTVDHILWRPGWTRVSDSDYAEKHEAWLNEERWLIDGVGPWIEIERRLVLADTIILVDLPIYIHFWWAVKRQLKSILGRNVHAPDGCDMWRASLKLFPMMWDLHRFTRPKMISAIASRQSTARVIVLRSPKSIKQFTA